MNEGWNAMTCRRRKVGVRGLALCGIAAALLVLAGCVPEAQTGVMAERRPVASRVQTADVGKSRPAASRVQTASANKPGCVLREFRVARRFTAEAYALPDPRFNVGEPLRLQIRVGAPAYVNLFHVSTSCKVTRLIRNRLLKEATLVDFPSAGMSIVVKPPPGEEAFYVVATRKKIDIFAREDILSGDEVASLDMSPAQFYTRLEDATGRINPDDLSVTTLRTSIVGR